jgi:hypothetical protein
VGLPVQFLPPVLKQIADKLGQRAAAQMFLEIKASSRGMSRGGPSSAGNPCTLIGINSVGFDSDEPDACGLSKDQRKRGLALFQQEIDLIVEGKIAFAFSLPPRPCRPPPSAGCWPPELGTEPLSAPVVPAACGAPRPAIFGTKAHLFMERRSALSIRAIGAGKRSAVIKASLFKSTLSKSTAGNGRREI